MKKIRTSITEKIRKFDWKQVGIMVLMAAVIIGFNNISGYAATAAPPNPGVKFGEWLQVNIVGVFGTVIALLGLFFLITRKIMRGIIFMFIAGLAAIMVFSGTDFAKIIGDLVMSFFK